MPYSFYLYLMLFCVRGMKQLTFLRTASLSCLPVMLTGFPVWGSGLSPCWSDEASVIASGSIHPGTVTWLLRALVLWQPRVVISDGQGSGYSRGSMFLALFVKVDYRHFPQGEAGDKDCSVSVSLWLYVSVCVSGWVHECVCRCLCTYMYMCTWSPEVRLRCSPGIVHLVIWASPTGLELACSVGWPRSAGNLPETINTSMFPELMWVLVIRLRPLYLNSK